MSVRQETFIAASTSYGWGAMSAVIILIIGSTMQSVVSVGINPAEAANSPCWNASGYSETQLSLLIDTITESEPAVIQLYSEPVDGRVLPGEEVTFLCCALVFSIISGGWSLLEWTINPEPSSNLFDRGSLKTVQVSMNVELYYRIMRVNGSLDNNGTKIKCDVTGNGFHTSDPKELIVMGKFNFATES